MFYLHGVKTQASLGSQVASFCSLVSVTFIKDTLCVMIKQTTSQIFYSDDCFILVKVVFFSHFRAAQKLSKKKKRHHPPEPELPTFPTKFSEILRVSAPPCPPCLLRNFARGQPPGMGKVRELIYKFFNVPAMNCVFVLLFEIVEMTILKWTKYSFVLVK